MKFYAFKDKDKQLRLLTDKGYAKSTWTYLGMMKLPAYDEETGVELPLKNIHTFDAGLGPYT